MRDDIRFNTATARAVNATERILLMGELIKARPTAEWLERLDAADVPSAPILRRGEVIHNEQVVARGLITELEQPGVGRIRQPRPAARFDGTVAQISGPAPRIGEHSRSVLRDLGLSGDEIEELAERRVIRCGMLPAQKAGQAGRAARHNEDHQD